MTSLSCRHGAEHTLFGCLNFSWYDAAPQAGARSSRPAAAASAPCCATRGSRPWSSDSGVKADSNHPADRERVDNVGSRCTGRSTTYDHLQCHMRTVGTAHLVEIMNDYDLLPTHNFQVRRHPEASKLYSAPVWRRFNQGIPDGCWYGCTMACSKGMEGYELRTGPYKGQIVTVDGPEYETIAGCGSNLGVFDPALGPRDQLLLRHLRHRHHLLWHRHGLRHGVL